MLPRISIRVLVVDDSAFMRKAISDIIDQQPDMETVGTARDGLDALEKVALLHPDVITLDVEMPRLDGLATLARLMEEAPCPAVMVSSLTREGAEATMRALALGAVDFVAKPAGTISLDMARVREELWQKVRAASRVSRERLRANRRALTAVSASTSRPAAEPVQRAHLSMTPSSAAPNRLVVIGASTGGPMALMDVIPRLAAEFRAAILLVQHMPAGFTKSLAKHLDSVSQVSVREARPGDVPVVGECLVAPGGYHMVLDDHGRITIDQSPPQHGVRPAVDVTIESAARLWGNRMVVVIMTGMGFDGARGAGLVRELGGLVVVQDEASCVVYGMPRAVVETVGADYQVPLSEIAGVVERLVADRAPVRGSC